jgi:nucleoside-diphosphate-sugar epimerase
MKQLPKEDLQYIHGNLGSMIYRLSGKHIFITGATGFIGSWLLESLIYIAKQENIGFFVTILTRDRERFLRNYPHLKESGLLNILESDIKSLEVGMIDRNIDYTIHAATDTNIDHNNPLLVADTIVQGMRNVLEMFRQRHKITKLLFLSSGAIYGKNSLVKSGFDETDLSSVDCNDPLSSYGEAKRYAELLCSVYYKQFNIPYNIARCFSFVGPRIPLNGHFAIGNFIQNILSNEDIIISGNGKDVRSYLYIADLVIWLFSILFDAQSARVYNVGSSEYYTIEQVAQIVISSTKSNQGYKILNKNINSTNYIPNVNKMLTELNVKIGHDLERSIVKTRNWYSEYKV